MTTTLNRNISCVCSTTLRRWSKFFVCAFSTLKHFIFVIFFLESCFISATHYVCEVWLWRSCTVRSVCVNGFVSSSSSSSFSTAAFITIFFLLLWIRLMRVPLCNAIVSCRSWSSAVRWYGQHSIQRVHAILNDLTLLYYIFAWRR